MIKKAAEYIRIPKKIFYPTLAIVVIAAVTWNMRPQTTPVDIVSIEVGIFKRIVEEEGYTYFKDRHTLSAPTDGVTPALKWEVGDAVKKDQTLVEFLWDSTYYLKSPIDGVVLKVFEKDRRNVPRGTPLIEVGDPNSIEIHSKVLSEEVVDIKKGQKAQLKNWGKDFPLEAEVVRIEPSAQEVVSALGVKEQRVIVHLKILTEREKWKSLGDQFRLDLDIITDEVNDAKLLPVAALVSQETQPSVYVFKNKKISLTPIEIGMKNQTFAVLQSDLPVGTQVVIYPGSQLKDGLRVSPRNK